jgi:hypothetical protein
MTNSDISKAISLIRGALKCMDIVDLIAGPLDATGADVSADLALGVAMVAA